jgi:hypothetical protein
VTRGEKGALLALVLLALFLRLWPVSHGMPRGYVPDGHVVRSALGMARDKDPIPPAGKYSTYPYLVPYMLLPVYAAQFGAGKVTGEWGGIDEFGRRAMAEPGIVQVPARALIGLLGALTVLGVFGAARAAGLQRGAWVAGWLSATCLLNVHLSTHERPWVALVFFASLSLWAAILHARHGKSGPLVLSCVAAGLAFACHQAGLTIFAIPGAAWLLGAVGWKGDELRQRLKSAVLAPFVGIGVAVLVGHPYYLRHGATSQDGVVGGALAADKFSIGGQAVNLGVSFESVRNLSSALFGYDPALLALGLAGIVFALRTRALRAPLLALALIAGFFLTNPSDHVRYLLPVCLLLTLPAGQLGERLLAHRLGTALLVPLLALPLVQSLRLGWVLRQEDTRARAERTLAELPEGSVVAIDHYGPRADLSLAGFERLFEIRDLYAREHYRAEQLQTGADVAPGVDAIQVEDLFELDPSGAYVVRERVTKHGATPLEVLQSLGVTHLMLAKRRPHEPDPWLQDVADSGRVVETIRPSDTTAAPVEAFLPTEMRFPLTGLWSVRRPGPWVRLVALGS